MAVGAERSEVRWVVVVMVAIDVINIELARVDWNEATE
jgi:hypothetical protein